MTAVTSLCNQLRKEHRNTTASMTEFQAQRFIDFKHGDFFLADMTPTHIEQYSSHLRIKGDSIAYQNVAMNKIRSIINYAIRNGLVRYEIHPFAYYRYAFMSNLVPKTLMLVPSEVTMKGCSLSLVTEK